MLSQVGKEVLIKSVAQAIPSCCMGVFLLLIYICDEIERMLNSFWWGVKGANRNGIRWMSWDKLIMRKGWGDMGFRNIYGFNLAMLWKQCCNFLTKPNIKVFRIFKAKYFPNGDFLGSSLGHNLIYVWRSIWSSRVLLKTGSRWKIGDGSLIPIWNTPWLRNDTNLYVVTPTTASILPLKVNFLIDANMGCWNNTYVRENFCIEILMKY